MSSMENEDVQGIPTAVSRATRPKNGLKNVLDQAMISRGYGATCGNDA